MDEEVNSQLKETLEEQEKAEQKKGMKSLPMLF